MSANVLPFPPGARLAAREKPVEKKPPAFKPQMSKKAAQEMALEIQLIYSETKGNCLLAIPRLADMATRRRRVHGERAYTLAKWYFETWELLGRFDTEELKKLRKDMPAIARRACFKAIKGGGKGHSTKPD